MENQNQKWVNLCYLAVVVLVAYILLMASTWLIASFDLEARVRNAELVARVLSVAVGAILYLFLYRHPQSNQFMNEVVSELSRVTWPMPKETASSTFVVLIMVLISGMVLGLLDYVWTAVMKAVL